MFLKLFLALCTVYNENQSLPWKETIKIGNTKNPYATSKYIIERMLMDLAKYNKNWSIRIARYFNAIGNHSSGLIKEETNGVPNFLVPYIVKVAKKELPYLRVFGKNYRTKDGTCIRDFIHVMDLADGHIALLKKIKPKKEIKNYNFWNGKCTILLEVIRAFEKQTGVPISFRFSKKRKGDAAVSYCSAKKALKELKWETKYNLNQAMMDVKKII